MSNNPYIQTLWEEMRLVYGISLRVYQAIPKEKMDSHPIPGMRTPKELIAHMTCTLRAVASGRGAIRCACHVRRAGHGARGWHIRSLQAHTGRPCGPRSARA